MFHIHQLLFIHFVDPPSLGHLSLAHFRLLDEARVSVWPHTRFCAPHVGAVTLILAPYIHDLHLGARPEKHYIYYNI